MSRISVWILGDQLLLDHPALVAASQIAARREICVVLVESAQRTARLPYQRKKLVLLFSAMRHYAEELRALGYTVLYLHARSVQEALCQHVADWQPERLLTMAAAEYRGRLFQQQRLSSLLAIPVEVLPNSQFLIGRFTPGPASGKKMILENFYRTMRRHWGLLLDAEGNPVGGLWNFDHDNRKPAKADLLRPRPRDAAPDAVVEEVLALVAARRARRARPHPHYPSSSHPLPTPTPIPQVVDTWLNNTYIPKANQTSPLAGAEYTLNQKLTNAVKVREGGGWGGGGDNVFFCFFRPHPPSFPPSLSPSLPFKKIEIVFLINY